MVKLLETSGVIEKTHVVLCTEHGPEQKNGFRFMYASVFFCVPSADYGQVRRRDVATATADRTQRDEIEAEGRHILHFSRRLLQSTLDAF